MLHITCPQHFKINNMEVMRDDVITDTIMISLTGITTGGGSFMWDNYDSSPKLMMGNLVNYMFPITFTEEK